MTSQTTVEKAPREPEDTLVPAPAKGLRGHPWLTLFAVAIGVMMVALDGTIVAIANPAIQQDLGASLAGAAITRFGPRVPLSLIHI